ncbi:DegT/DnrJ/EryC1/StrS aminotransferase family protein [bacterium]|jgi:dTDP-4-amino-4,6-dideoxygalactose transaminase|nr:DegT/DnrJ/EryC1/StrS aminotransferase family protein [bacterium]MBT6831668.1 DegT/DnrJ/EryC1/StrS aminotransferase family protein [bacterium]MBT6996314.1 DegT/DnrJ/EryC1/StrS aminotransferase family protein [bacterium]MBT7772992.1 DegT/DnrJ/EryC1/StrS aminotransferase family protein [bacterium]
MKLVSNQISPNFSFADALHAAWQIFGGKVVKKNEFEQIFYTEKFQLVSAARTALGLIAEDLKKRNARKKIGIPAFCCAVMATPFLEKNFEIEWIDTDEFGVISVADFEKKSDALAAILIPHIFGQRAPVAEIVKIARAKKIVTIEDAAHFFEKKCEKTDFKILSFGREKDVSCISGGALLWSDSLDSQTATKLENLNLRLPTKSWTAKHLLQPLVFSLSLPWWNFGGKVVAAACGKAFLPRAVTAAEKSGHEDFFAGKMPAAIQRVLRKSFENHDHDLAHRKKIAAAWRTELLKNFPEAKIVVPPNFLRVILIGVDRAEILKKSRKIGFHLADWDGSPIAPAGVNLGNFGYKKNQCPGAENFAKKYVTFPTNRRTNLSDVKKFAKLFGKK